MAKLTYGSTISAIYDPQVGAPLDSRMAVAKFSDLIDITTWKTNGGTSAEAYSYYGMLVYVGQDGDKNGLYTLEPSGIEGRTVTTDTEDENCWIRISQPDSRINEIEKKLEEFTPKIQSQLQMYVYDIDENGNISTETTGDVANIQIVREPNGTMAFKVKDTSTAAEVLAGNSNTTINTTLQLYVNNKDTDGTITPSIEVANVMVVRNANGKMSIRIS